MYAVFTDGSHQYRVSEGDTVKVDFRELEPGAAVQFPNVLLYANGDDVRIGRPQVDGVSVSGEVVDQTSLKLRVGHFRRRKNYRRVKGHRQWHTLVKVTAIG
jgi:large subunit ribosomal protein L21